MKVYLLPYSGGSSLCYRKWKSEILKFVSVEYKGHGRRINEGNYKDVQDAANDVAEFINNNSQGEEYAIFGHSLGGLIAYEVYCVLAKKGYPLPKHLFISACRAPHYKARVKVSELDESEYREMVMVLGGVTDEFFDNERIFEAFNPILYHDFLLNECYECSHLTKIACNITLLVGTDDTSVTQEENEAWNEYGQVSRFNFEGNHFFIDQHIEEIIEIIKKTLASRVPLEPKKKDEVHTLYDLLMNVSNIEDKGIIIIKGDTDKILSYRSLYEKACYFFWAMHEKGVKQHDEVIIATDAIEEFLISFWGCILGGFTAVPITCSNSIESYARLDSIWKQLKNPYLVSKEKILHAFQDYMESQKIKLDSRIQTNCIDIAGICDEELRYTDVIGKLDDIYIPKEEDVAFIQFSSGSTGTPKGVILKHCNLIANIKSIIKGLGNVTEEDSSLSWLPLTHDMGLIGFHLSPMYCKANQSIMMPLYYMKRPLKWLEKVSQYKATIINSPNFGYEYFFQAFQKVGEIPYDLSHVRVIFNGAEPVSYDLCVEFLNALRKNKLRSNAFFPVYGMAEASLAVTFPDVNAELEYAVVDRNYLNIGDTVKVVGREEANAVTFVKLGKAIDQCEYRITSDDKVCGPMTVGYIEIRGKNVTSGYYGNKGLTKELFSSDGWLRTGDVGAIIDDQLIVIGRTKEVIIINGKNYFPDDIERVAAKWVENEKYNIAAIGVLDQIEMVEEIVLFVKNRKNLKDFCEIQDNLKKAIGFQFGTNVTIVPILNLPRTTSGKIQRSQLKKRYEAGEFNEVLADVASLYEEYCQKRKQQSKYTATEEKLVTIFEKVFPLIHIGVYDNYMNYGIQSIQLVKIVNEVQEQFPDNRIDLNSVYTFQTICELGKYIDEQRHTTEEKSRKIYDIDELLEIM